MVNLKKQLDDADKKRVADQLRTGVVRFNKLLGNAKDAGLRVKIFGKSDSQKTQINEYTDLFVSTIEQVKQL